MGHPDDSGMGEQPERFDEFTGGYTAAEHDRAMVAILSDINSTPPEGQDAKVGKDAPEFDADAFVKAKYTPIQIGYMLTGDWDSIAAAIRLAYLTGKVDGGRVIARAAGVEL